MGEVEGMRSKIAAELMGQALLEGMADDYPRPLSAEAVAALSPEPPPASSDPGIGPPSFLDHPIWEPTIRGFMVLVLGSLLGFVLFGFIPLVFASVNAPWWLVATSVIFSPAIFLTVFLLSFIAGVIVDKLGFLVEEETDED